METVINVASILSISILFGTMFFFSFTLTPLIFTSLQPDIAASFIRKLFPWYYLVVGCLSLVGAISLYGNALVYSGLLAIVCITTLVCRQILMPIMNSQRDKSPYSEKAANIFNQLHAVSVFINFGQLILSGIVLIGYYA